MGSQATSSLKSEDFTVQQRPNPPSQGNRATARQAKANGPSQVCTALFLPLGQQTANKFGVVEVNIFAAKSPAARQSY
jgi:hypothetical protein